MHLKPAGNRKLFIQFHLLLAAFFLPFLLLMPLTGASHLLRIPAEQEKTAAFTISSPIPADAREREAFFREQFRSQGIDFDFEYIRESGNDFVFRPSSRVHYIATRTPTGAAVTRVNPGLLRRLTEIHRGHGPTLMRSLEIAFGVALLLVTFSGLWLALTVPAYRNLTLAAFGAGILVIFFAVAG